MSSSSGMGQSGVMALVLGDGVHWERRQRGKGLGKQGVLRLKIAAPTKQRKSAEDYSRPSFRPIEEIFEAAGARRRAGFLPRSLFLVVTAVA